MGHAHQYRADADAVGHHPRQVVSGVGGVKIGQYQYIRAAAQSRIRKQAFANIGGEGGVDLHLAFGFQFWIALANDLQRPTQFQRADGFVGTEIGMADQRNFWRDAEQLQPIRRLQGRLGNLFGTRIVLHMGIDEKEWAFIGHHNRHRRQRFHARIEPKHINDMLELALITADQTTKHGVGFTALYHQCRDHRTARTHNRFRCRRRHATPRHELVILLPVDVEAGIVVGIGQIKIAARLQTQAHPLNTPLDHRRTTYQDRSRQPVVNHGLHSAQHGFFFAFGKYHALAIGAGAIEQRLHQQAGAIDELR